MNAVEARGRPACESDFAPEIARGAHARSEMMYDTFTLDRFAQ